MKELIIVRIVENGETSYELRDDRGNFIADHTDLKKAVEDAICTADNHGIEFVKIKAEAELC
jgi:hypothetical protein